MLGMFELGADGEGVWAWDRGGNRRKNEELHDLYFSLNAVSKGDQIKEDEMNGSAERVCVCVGGGEVRAKGLLGEPEVKTTLMILA